LRKILGKSFDRLSNKIFEAENRLNYKIANLLANKVDKVGAAVVVKEEEDIASEKHARECEEWTDYQLKNGIVFESDNPKLVQEQSMLTLQLYEEWIKTKETPEYKEKWAERRRQQRLEIELKHQKEREEEDREILRIMESQKQKLPEDPEQAEEVLQLQRKLLQRRKRREVREMRANYRDEEEGRDFFGFQD
jgi:hypothetical protein